MTSPEPDRDDVTRVLRDLIQARRSDPARLPTDADFKDPRWELDSIVLMELAGAVTEMFHLHEVGLEDNLLRFRSLPRWVDVVLVCRRRHARHLTFRTSGTTGSPRPVCHAMTAIAAEAEALSDLFGKSRRIISMVPAHHLYGFMFTVALPRILDVPVLDGRDMGSGAFHRSLCPGDLVVSFPLNWRFLDQCLPRWPEGVWGVCSAGEPSPDTARRLLQRGLEKLWEIYGSTETGGVGYRQSPEESFTLLPHWQGISESDPPELYPGVNTGREESLQVPDRLIPEGPRRFRLGERLDGAIKIGGVTVFPHGVERRLRNHPLVRDCVVRSMDSPAGLRLEALVVPVSDMVAITKEVMVVSLRQWMARELPAAERPVRVIVVNDIPSNALGKSVSGVVGEWPSASTGDALDDEAQWIEFPAANP